MQKKKIDKAYTEVNDSFDDDDYQSNQFYRKPDKTSTEIGSKMSNYTFSKTNNMQSMQKELRARSSLSAAKSEKTTSTIVSKQGGIGLTRLRLSRKSLKVGSSCGSTTNKKQDKKATGGRSNLSRDSSQTARESSTESLDRIHTFNLKNFGNPIGETLRHS